jgi:hypothetical protein
LSVVGSSSIVGRGPELQALGALDQESVLALASWVVGGDMDGELVRQCCSRPVSC